MNTNNPRYKIRTMAFKGVIHAIDELIPFSSGNGYFRTMVIAEGDGPEKALIPITVFGDDAVNLDGNADVGKTIDCQVTLQSRTYINKTGGTSWSLSFKCNSMTIESPKQQPARTDWPIEPDDNDWAKDSDDIPF